MYARNTIFCGDYEIPAPIVVQFKSLQAWEILKCMIGPLPKEPASRVSEFKKTTGNSMISCLNFLMDRRFAQISAKQQTNKHAEHPTISACPLRSGTVTCTFKIKHSIVVLRSTQVKASQISKSLWSPRTKRGHFQNRKSIWISMNLLLPAHLTFENLNYSNLFFRMSLAETCNQSIKLELDLTGRLAVMSGRGCTLGVAVRWSTKAGTSSPNYWRHLVQTWKKTCTEKVLPS